MRKFDGLHPNSINTIFGIFQINVAEEIEYPNIVIQQVTETLIMPKIQIKGSKYFNDRRFKSNEDAYAFMYNLEQSAIKELGQILLERF